MAGGSSTLPGFPCPASAIWTSWLRSTARLSACRTSRSRSSGLPPDVELAETLIPMWWNENPGSEIGFTSPPVPRPSQIVGGTSGRMSTSFASSPCAITSSF